VPLFFGLFRAGRLGHGIFEASGRDDLHLSFGSIASVEGRGSFTVLYHDARRGPVECSRSSESEERLCQDE
jgi:hypothetical protein